MPCKMTDKVQHPVTDEITTLTNLDARGEIVFRESKMPAKNEQGWRIRYFACIKGREPSGWEISRAAFCSRTGQRFEVNKGNARPERA